MTQELRKTGIAAVGDVPWGAHFCHFYQTKEDLLDIMVPYFRAGLDGDELCVWVVSDPLDEQQARDALCRALPGVERNMAAGDLEIVPHPQWYLEGGAFAFERVIRRWHEKLGSALSRGYTGLRVNGLTAWLTHADWPLFSAYEERFNEQIAGQKLLVICTYPLATTPAADMLDIARTHQFAIARRNGNWEILETPDLKQAKQEIKRLNDQLVARIVERTSALAVANRELEAQIAKHERVGQELRQQKEILQTIFDHVPVMLNFFDAEGRLKLVNREWERILGWSLDEIVAHNMDIFAECYPDPQDYERVRKFIAESNAEWADFKTRVRDGRTLDTAWAVVHLSDATIIGIGQDITERKALEHQLRQAQKIEAVGQLAGGIAHDFNNLLTVINGYCALLAERATTDEESKAELRQIVEAGERAALLTRRLLAFSRRQIVQPVVITLNAVVSGFQPMLRRLIPEDIELSIEMQPEAGEVKADPAQLEQVVMNLALNARDAMPDGGRLTIRTAKVELDDSYARSHPGLKPGTYAALEVADIGVGMNEATKARIFEPFFTTKEAGRGTGLGLSVVYGVVRQSGGHIQVHSQPGVGTTLTIFLPSVSEPVQNVVGPVRGALPRGQETILLVEDDEAVRSIAGRILTDQGYTVVEAGSGQEALATSAHLETTIDLLLTDVVMPGMSGPVLADELKRTRPGLKVLFVSGYVDDAIVRRRVAEPGSEFLAKPFSPEVLTQRVREVLDAPWGRASAG